MTDTSPRPWSLFVHEEEYGGDGEISICAENEWIATMNLRRSTAESDAALIVKAVNERDRLRDIVRRLAHAAQDTLDFAEVMSGIIPDNPERAKARSEIEALLREARAAIVS